jgi:putative heme-binding domain-containing protein
MLFTFARNDAGAANAKFPTKLSETGLFADVKKHEMAEGVVPFTPNLPQWQDGAQAQHWVALPNGNPVTAFERPRPLPGQVFWHNFKLQFPQNAVLVKTLTVTVPRFATKRVETQLLHYDGEDWRGYSYAWRDDQSDADLVPAEGDEKTILVEDRFNAGQKTERTWVFHSRTQCLICHNAWSEYTLAFNLPQLNNSRTRELRHPSQLVALSERGLLRRVDANEKPLPGYDEATAAKEPALANNYGPPAAELDHAARSYLHVNCAHCHRFGGGGGQVVLELDFTKALKETGILDVPPKQGDFGIANAKLVAAGDPYRSVLYYRVSKFGRGRMPHLGSEVPHFSGNELLAKWIASLDGKEPEPRATNAKNIGDSLSTLRTAYAYSRPLGNRSAFTPDDREAILAAASKLPPSPVRDLFEGYLPSDPKGRKLGANPRPATILALKGDATKGETLFFNKEMKCANCHKVGDKGLSLGPELTKIGSNRTRAELLDSLLNPSARVEPQYAAYNIRTKDEKTYTGIIVKRDETQLILRDAENKELRIAGDNVDSVRPARMSLMPDGQMSALTPQEAADLLEYLTQRK